MEENELYNRIGETDLNPTYKDGQTYQHTDINQMLGMLKTAINENYYDIQRLLNGAKTVGNANQLDDATLSRYIDEELQSDDNKIPSSQQAKAYMDALFAGYSAPVRGVDYWTEADQQQIVSDTASNVIEEITPDLEEALNAKANINDIPTKISDLQNDSDFLSENNLQMVKSLDIQNGSQITDATGYSRINKIYGDLEQDGIPTPTTPIETETVIGDIELIIKDSNNNQRINTISLGDIELCKMGTNQDYIYKKENGWYLHKEIGKRVLNGTENWYIWNGNLYTQSIIDYGRVNNIPICSHYKGVSMSAGTITPTTLNDKTVRFSNNTNLMNSFYVMDANFSSVNDFKTWLSTNNITVYYLLATPLDIKITDETLINNLNEIINLYSGTTNFEITSEELAPKLNITYAITNRDIYSKEETNDLIDQNINGSDNYYEEINYIRERANSTDYYITSIPKYDSVNNIIDLYAADSGDNKNPLEYAQENYTTLTLNVGYPEDRCYVGNGNIIRDIQTPRTTPSESYYIGITKNREIKEYKIENVLNAQQLINDGCYNVFPAYFKMVDNGQVVTDYPLSEWAQDLANSIHPRQAIGVKSDGTIVVATCDGRTTHDRGMTSAELANIMISKGCTNAWMLDGGGSSCTVIRGNKINKNIDENGTKIRNIKYVLNVKRNTVNKPNGNAFNKIGDLKQDLIKDIYPFLNLNNRTTNIDGHDLNTEVGQIVMAYGNNCINKPNNSTNGYFMNIPHYNEELSLLYNMQYWFNRDDDKIFTRRMVNGVFKDWININGSQQMEASNSGYTPSTTSVYEVIPLKILYASPYIIGDETSKNENNSYNRFKINVAYNKKIKIYVEVNVTVGATARKFLEIRKNNSQLGVGQSNMISGDKQQIIVSRITELNNNDTFEVRFYGNSNDNLTCYVIAEIID